MVRICVHTWLGGGGFSREKVSITFCFYFSSSNYVSVGVCDIVGVSCVYGYKVGEKEEVGKKEEVGSKREKFKR